MHVLCSAASAHQRQELSVRCCVSVVVLCSVLGYLEGKLEMSNTVKDMVKLSVGAFFLSHWVRAASAWFIGARVFASSHAMIPWGT
jgi:hypothetical protein